jgi:hypothetical protein
MLNQNGLVQQEKEYCAERLNVTHYHFKDIL